MLLATKNGFKNWPCHIVLDHASCISEGIVDSMVMHRPKSSSEMRQQRMVNITVFDWMACQLKLIQLKLQCLTGWPATGVLPWEEDTITVFKNLKERDKKAQTSAMYSN